ncbi:MAG TPA: PASTA domain-containing protein [Pilimelia sp.]|nr:PASTA domain-containing protein [Pilimelia sp.]
MPDDKTPSSEGPAGPAETAPLPAASDGPAEPDETAQLPAAAAPGPDETAQLPTGPDETAALPKAGTWSARAEVPPPGAPAGYRYGGPGDTAYRPGQAVEWDEGGPDDEGGRWWLPIVIAVVALLLLGVLGFGLWLISSAEDGTEPAGPTPAPSRATPTTRPAPTTKPPGTTAPAAIPVPPVVGLPAADAQTALSSVGLVYRLEFRPSETAPPGTVIASDPPPGVRVPPGSEITLVIATAPRTTPPVPTPTTSPPATPNG